ncbi:MAG TPA: hypothetical protein PK264_07775 [Hyphomicrobiaceae bacterium]|nr:hypothetical protein [Hyphomicrobiaceae bacterium]
MATLAVSLQLADPARLMADPLADRLAEVGKAWAPHKLSVRPAVISATPILPEHAWLSRFEAVAKANMPSVGDTHMVPVVGGGEHAVRVVGIREIDAVKLGIDAPAGGRRLVLISLQLPGDGDGRLVRIITETTGDSAPRSDAGKTPL